MTMFGFSPDELMGKRFIDLIIPEDVQETIKAVRAIRAEQATDELRKPHQEERCQYSNSALVGILVQQCN